METTIKYITTQEAYDILDKVPEEDWCVGKYESIRYLNEGLTKTCHCAMGIINCARSNNKSASDSVEDGGLFGLGIKPADMPFRYRTSRFLNDQLTIFSDITNVNDNDTRIRERYPQPTPKARVLALLKDMLAAGY